MLEVTGVSFRPAGKIYYFSSNGLESKLGDNVIVETSRGIDYGRVVKENFLIDENSFKKPLKPILRMADSSDDYIYQENIRKAKDAMKLCSEKIKEHGLDMNLVDCEYTFDSSRIIFYFTSDDRVDFRELVKDLARIFKVRIELRQIGIRDQAKCVSGLGPCGQECCCKRFMRDFNPVSIKMAKDQSLSLNQSKISGMCGRLMCCLNYEQEGYEEKLRKMPRIGAIVNTEYGQGKVVSSNTLLENVVVKIEENDNYEFYTVAIGDIIK
ncbi:MAG: stage 0 sporulation family protein [Finegoldia sp.]|nr:stage 0 sporulation family protein [Finegoldia sp.]